MNKRTMSVTLLLSLALTGGLLVCKKGNSEFEGDSRVTGGTCTYADKPATIIIKKIIKEPRRENTSSGDSEMVIIQYELAFDSDIQSGKVQGGEVAVKLVEAESKGIKVGKQFHASVHELVSGTCNPEPHDPDFREWK